MPFGRITPTPEQLAQFPEPNYVDPKTRVPVVLGLVISTCILMSAFVCGRLYARGVIKAALGIDDYTMLIAALLGASISILGAVSCLFGLGYHVWDLRSEWSKPYYKIGFAIQFMYPLAVGLTKISICQTYLRIFPSKSNRIFCLAMTAVLICYTITCVFLMLFQCHPIQAYWDISYDIHCVDMRSNFLSIAALNTVTDFLIYLWPAHYLWRIQLPTRQRVGLIFVFTLGCIVCVAGVCRMYFLYLYFTTIDLLWNAALTTSIAIIEINVGIICGCLPGIKPLIRKFLPRWLSSSGRSTHTRRTDSRSHPYANAQSFPFQTLSVGNDKRSLKSGSRCPATHLENIEDDIFDSSPSSAYHAYASSGFNGENAAHGDGILINQVVTMESTAHDTDVDAETDDRRSDTESEVWIMGKEKQRSNG